MHIINWFYDFNLHNLFYDVIHYVARLETSVDFVIVVTTLILRINNFNFPIYTSCSGYSMTLNIRIRHRLVLFIFSWKTPFESIYTKLELLIIT